LDDAARFVRAAALRARERFEDATGERGWYPWDREYAERREAGLPDRAFAARSMVPSVLAGVRAWGFPSRALKFRIDRHDIPFGGVEIPVDAPGDVRVIVHPAAGWNHYWTLFHEVGHAVHARSTAVHPPLLRWHEYLPGFPGFVEGIGMLFEEIPVSPEWLRTRPGIRTSAARDFARVHRNSEVLSLAWLIAWIRGELELYRNPEGDIRTFRYRWVRRLGGYDAFDPPSFADWFYANNPVYTQSYVFAGLFAKQLLAWMRSELGDRLWPNRRFGPYLATTWFRPSGEFDWVPYLKAQTGEAFGPRCYNEWARSVVTDAG
jgi:hypothetical protein